MLLKLSLKYLGIMGMAGTCMCMYSESTTKLPFTKPAAQATAEEIKADDFIILYQGNSITRHGFNESTIKNLGWDRECGMTASDESKDYAHLLAGKIGDKLKRNVRIFFSSDDLKATAGKDINPNLVVVQGGEHAASFEKIESFKENYEKQLAGWKKIAPVIAIGIWNPRCQEEFQSCTAAEYDVCAKRIEKEQKEVTKKLGIPFASVSIYENDPKNTGEGKTAAVRWHPNDEGMKKYAEAAFKAFQELNWKN